MEIRNMKKYTAILATLLVGAVSCNPLDILNTKPEATLDKETFFKQEDNLRMYSDAFYGVYNDIEGIQGRRLYTISSRISIMQSPTFPMPSPFTGSTSGAPSLSRLRSASMRELSANTILETSHTTLLPLGLPNTRLPSSCSLSPPKQRRRL